MSIPDKRMEKVKLDAVSVLTNNLLPAVESMAGSIISASGGAIVSVTPDQLKASAMFVAESRSPAMDLHRVLEEGSAIASSSSLVIDSRIPNEVISTPAEVASHIRAIADSVSELSAMISVLIAGAPPMKEAAVKAIEAPVADEPVADEPVADEPVADEPVADEPVADEPVADEPVK